MMKTFFLYVGLWMSFWCPCNKGMGAQIGADSANTTPSTAANTPTTASVPSEGPSTTDALTSFLADFDSKKINAVLAKMPPEPLLSVSIAALPNLLGKALKLVEKVYPEFGAVMFMGVTSFLGGVQCPGFDTHSNIHLYVCPDADGITGIWFFKATADCPLVKNLAGLKNGDFQLFGPQHVDKEKYGWYIYGTTSFYKRIQQNLENFAPFMKGGEPELSKLCQVELDFNTILPIIDAFPVLLQRIFKDFVLPDIKKLILDVDFNGEQIEMQQRVYFDPSSPIWAYYKALQETLPQAHILQWNALEPIRDTEIYCYSESQNCYAALSKRAAEKEWHSDPMAAQVYQWGEIVHPIIEEFLSFCAQYLTGSYQSYGYFQKSCDFGFFETKKLNDAQFVSFLEHIIQETLHKQVALAIQKKLQWSEFLQLFKAVLDKNFQQHQGCAIHGVSFNLTKTKDRKPYTWVFALCNNYLLYANTLEDLKRLIERINAMKTPVYVPMNNYFQRIDMDLAALIKTFFNLTSTQDSILTLNTEVKKEINALALDIKFPLFFNVQMFLNMLKDSGAKPQPKPAPGATSSPQSK